jgi:hypothetical protein
MKAPLCRLKKAAIHLIAHLLCLTLTNDFGKRPKSSPRDLPFSLASRVDSEAQMGARNGRRGWITPATKFTELANELNSSMRAAERSATFNVRAASS